MSYSVFLLYSFSANAMRAVAVLTCLLLSNRRLSYAKIMQDECNVKTGKRSFTGLDTAEPMLILCKDSERLAHCKLKSVVFSIFADIVQYTILCQIRSGKINN